MPTTHEGELSGDTRIPLSLKMIWVGGGAMIAIIGTIVTLTVHVVRAYDRLETLEKSSESVGSTYMAALAEETQAREAEDAAIRARQERLEDTMKNSVTALRDSVSALRGDMAGIRSDLRLLVTQVNLVVPGARKTPIQLPTTGDYHPRRDP